MAWWAASGRGTVIVAGRSTRSLDVVMDPSHTIECSVHGAQEEAFVCQHIAESLRTGKPVGFHSSSESTSRHPDAWCSACEVVRTENDGEWTDQLVLEVLNVQLICGACYDQARAIWEQGRKIAQ